MSFLKILCSCMGQPLARNQKKIVKNVLKDPNCDLLLPWRISLNGLEVMQGGRWIDFGGMANETETAWTFHQTTDKGAGEKKAPDVIHVPPKYISEEMDPWLALKKRGGVNNRSANAQPTTSEEKLLLYHIECIDLLVVLCTGRSREAIDFILKNGLAPSYPNIMSLLKKPKLPLPLKVAYTSLMAKLYIDREPAHPIQFLRMTRIWSKLRVLPPEPLPMPDPYEQFPQFRPTQNYTDLIEYLHEHFSFALTVSEHTYSFDKCNSVMLDILYELTRFGFIGLDAAARVDDNQREYDFQQVQCMGYLGWASWHHGIMAS